MAIVAAAATAVLAAAAGPVDAGERGFFGLSVEVDLVENVRPPTLKDVRVEKVLPGFPADKAGIRAGDRVIAVEDRPVAGGNATDLDRLMRRDVGQPLRLRLRRGDAEPYAVTLVAVPRRSD